MQRLEQLMNLSSLIKGINQIIEGPEEGANDTELEFSTRAEEDAFLTDEGNELLGDKYYSIKRESGQATAVYRPDIKTEGDLDRELEFSTRQRGMAFERAYGRAAERQYEKPFTGEALSPSQAADYQVRRLFEGRKELGLKDISKVHQGYGSFNENIDVEEMAFHLHKEPQMFIVSKRRLDDINLQRKTTKRGRLGSDIKEYLSTSGERSVAF